MLKIKPTEMPLSPAQLTNTSGLGLIQDFHDTHPPEESKDQFGAISFDSHH